MNVNLAGPGDDQPALPHAVLREPLELASAIAPDSSRRQHFHHQVGRPPDLVPRNRSPGGRNEHDVRLEDQVALGVEHDIDRRHQRATQSAGAGVRVEQHGHPSDERLVPIGRRRRVPQHAPLQLPAAERLRTQEIVSHRYTVSHPYPHDDDAIVRRSDQGDDDSTPVDLTIVRN